MANEPVDILQIWPMPASLTPTNLAAALIALNLVTFVLFGIDMAKAEVGALIGWLLGGRPAP